MALSISLFLSVYQFLKIVVHFLQCSHAVDAGRLITFNLYFLYLFNLIFRVHVNDLRGEQSQIVPGSRYALSNLTVLRVEM